jgi:hypothetical protein
VKTKRKSVLYLQVACNKFSKNLLRDDLPKVNMRDTLHDFLDFKKNKKVKEIFRLVFLKLGS